LFCSMLNMSIDDCGEQSWTKSVRPRTDALSGLFNNHA
jgi:hypothetical protein